MAAPRSGVSAGQAEEAGAISEKTGKGKNFANKLLRIWTRIANG
jgi:hypothetical protein